MKKLLLPLLVLGLATSAFAGTACGTGCDKPKDSAHTCGEACKEKCGDKKTCDAPKETKSEKK